MRKWSEFGIFLELHIEESGDSEFMSFADMSFRLWDNVVV